MVGHLLFLVIGAAIAAWGVRGLFTLPTQYFHHSLRASQFGTKASARWWFLVVNGAASVLIALLGLSMALIGGMELLGIQ
jgi:hypothetical protein